MKLLSIFLYGVACYAVSLATFLYALEFFGNMGAPRAVDSARAAPGARAPADESA